MPSTRGSADAIEVAERLFTKLVDELDATKAATGDGKRLFFPDGIELIYLKATVSGFTAEIKIAGEKGLKVDTPVDADALAVATPSAE